MNGPKSLNRGTATPSPVPSRKNTQTPRTPRVLSIATPTRASNTHIPVKPWNRVNRRLTVGRFSAGCERGSCGFIHNVDYFPPSRGRHSSSKSHILAKPKQRKNGWLLGQPFDG